MKQSNTAMWVIIAVLVIALIGIAGVLVYQLGQRSSGAVAEATQTAQTNAQATFNAQAADVFATNTAVANLNLATQTAAVFSGTRSAMEAAFNATSTAIFDEATAAAQLRFATQTAVAPKPVASLADVTLIPGKYRVANWSIEVSVSPLDDKIESSSRLLSDGTDIYSSSSLTVECQKSEFTVHFRLSSVITLDGQTVQIRLDKEPARVLKPTEYTGSSFLGLASPRAFLKSLVGHDQLVIAVGEFTPVVFSITDVDIAAAFALKACGFE